MTISASIDISQSLPTIIAYIQLAVPDLAKGMGERLSKGESPEVILAEIVHSTQGTPEGKGLAYLVSAIQHLKGKQYEAALKECEAAQQAWPDGTPIIQFIRAHALNFLNQLDEAFAAFEESYAGIWQLLDSAETHGMVTRDHVEKIRENFYKMWTISALPQGLVGLAYFDSDELQRGGEKVVAVLRRAKEEGLEDSVWSIINQVEEALPPEIQDQMQALRSFIQLIAIEDPFERMKALAKSITAIWPKDVDCVDAVREQRR